MIRYLNIIRKNLLQNNQSKILSMNSFGRMYDVNHFSININYSLISFKRIIKGIRKNITELSSIIEKIRETDSRYIDLLNSEPEIKNYLLQTCL